jgi:hypothetical protein
MSGLKPDPTSPLVKIAVKNRSHDPVGRQLMDVASLDHQEE